MTHPTRKQILTCKVVCVSGLCCWIFMNATRKLLTVYKEGACRSIGVCIFNQFVHISIFSLQETGRAEHFSLISISASFQQLRIIIDRQINVMFRTSYHIANPIVCLTQNSSDSSLATNWTTCVCFGKSLWKNEHHTFELSYWEAEPTGLRKRWLLFTWAKNRTVQ